MVDQLEAWVNWHGLVFNQREPAATTATNCSACCTVALVCQFHVSLVQGPRGWNQACPCQVASSTSYARSPPSSWVPSGVHHDVHSLWHSPVVLFCVWLQANPGRIMSSIHATMHARKLWYKVLLLLLLQFFCCEVWPSTSSRLLVSFEFAVGSTFVCWLIWDKATIN